MKSSKVSAVSRDPRNASGQKNNRHLILMRIAGLLTIGAGLNYIVWRYAFSVNPNALWFAIPLLIAETYGLIDLCLMVIMIWKPRVRVGAPEPIDASVDVFITTYNEDLDLVKKTLDATMRIKWKKK